MVVVDVVDLGSRGTPLHIGHRFTIGEDVLVDRVPVYIVQLEGVGRRGTVGPQSNPFVVNIVKIRSGHHFTNTVSRHVKSILYLLSSSKVRRPNRQRTLRLGRWNWSPCPHRTLVRLGIKVGMGWTAGLPD